MPKRKLPEKGKSPATLVSDAGMFKRPKAVDKKILKEETLLIRIIREQEYDEIKKDLKKELGEEYTEQDTKTFFSLYIEKLREDGVIQKMLDAYLKEKIREEREKFGSTGINVPPSKGL